jgi:hypothetical protein
VGERGGPVMADTNGLVWRKSRRCDAGNCVEISMGLERVLVRDSADPDGPWLSSSHDRWIEFLVWLKRQDTSAS